MQKPRKEQYSDTLSNIRKAVDDLVAVVGFDKMRIRDICEKAGISVGTFYHYFSSKDELLLDRYLQYNDYIRTFYFTTLQYENEVDAIQHLLVALFAYIEKSFGKVLYPYYFVLLKKYDEWLKVEENQMEVVFHLLATNGLEKGILVPLYTPDEITQFLMTFFLGVLSRQCMESGAYIAGGGKRELRVVNNWVEALRKTE